VSDTGRHHSTWNCQHEDPATVALPRVNLTTLKITNPVVREWRNEYLKGFGRAAYDLNVNRVPDLTFTHGHAFNAFTLGYRAALRSARGE
jgi:hypothetical protein